MLLKPTVKLNKITDIKPSMLQKNGIHALILDVDNTLSTHHGQQLIAGLEDWLHARQEEGVKLIILSNSKRDRVEPLAAKIGLRYICLGLKPFPFRFHTALRALGARPGETAIVGDQIFTDVLGGNMVRIKTILLDPILPETTPYFRFKRKLEKGVMKLHHIETTQEE